jgi:hypothetical protein
MNLFIIGMANALGLDCGRQPCSQVKGADIAALLEGNRITPSMRYQQHAPPAAEWFGSDHKWHATLQSFSLKQISGTWDVEGDLVCVSPALSAKFCRGIWRDEKTREISIAMAPEWSDKGRAITVDIIADTWGAKR